MSKKIASTAPEAPVASSLKARLKNIDVLERRLQSPFGEGSPPVKLKEDGWTLHVVNTGLREGRYHDVVRNKHWEPVLPEEVDGDPADFGFDVRDGRVVRGIHGQEVLMKMPTEWAEKIARKKAEINTRALGKTAMRATAVERTAKEHGDEAADLVDRSIAFTATRAPVPLEGEGE